MTQTKAELLQTRHQGDIRLGDADSTHYVGFKAPATVGTSLVWTLPAVDGTANYLLKTDGSGNLGWVADSSTDSTKMPLSGGNFSGHVTFLDNIKAKFGSGGDLEIFHDTNDSYITNTGVGNLIIRGDDVHIQGSNGENMVNCNEDGSVDISFNNVKKFETYGSGIKAYNHVRVEGLEGENAVLALYADEGDDAADLWIMAANTSGALEIQQWNGSAWEDVIKATGGGAVELYHNNAKKFQTTSTGAHVWGNLDFMDNAMIRLGTNTDLELVHDGTNSRIKDTGSGNLKLSGSGVDIENAANTETMASFSENGAVSLYYNNVKKIETTSAGSKFTGGVSQVATAAGALDLDLNTSNYFTKTISGNSTFTFSNPAASGTVTAFTLELTHSSGTVTWPSEVKWNADTAPTLTTGKTHLFMFVTDDGGSRYRGSALVDYVN